MVLIEESIACSQGFYFLIFSLTYSVKQQRQNGQELTNVASKFHPLDPPGPPWTVQLKFHIKPIGTIST